MGRKLKPKLTICNRCQVPKSSRNFGVMLNHAKTVDGEKYVYVHRRKTCKACLAEQQKERRLSKIDLANRFPALWGRVTTNELKNRL